MRLRELAGSRVRYGYRRLTVMLKREGWEVNAKRIYRLYTEEGLIVRTQKRRERAQRQRIPSGQAIRAGTTLGLKNPNDMDVAMLKRPDCRRCHDQQVWPDEESFTIRHYLSDARKAFEAHAKSMATRKMD